MRFLFFISLLIACQLNAKVRILTFHYNLPELIEIQYKTLKKFSKEDFELIVFNDAPLEVLSNQIEETCKKFGILCVRYQQEWHHLNPLNATFISWCVDPNLYSHIGPIYSNHPSLRHCHVIQYALDLFGYNHNDLVALLDGDCFLSRPTSFKKLLGKKSIVGIKKEQGGYDYLWVVFTLFNPKKVLYIEDLKFDIDIIGNQIHDTGSHTYHYLQHPGVTYEKVIGYPSALYYHHTDIALKRKGFTPEEISLFRDLDSLKGFPWPITVELHMNNHFIHLGNSSFGLPGSQEKLIAVKKFVKTILLK